MINYHKNLKFASINDEMDYFDKTYDIFTNYFNNIIINKYDNKNGILKYYDNSQSDEVIGNNNGLYYENYLRTINDYSQIKKICKYKKNINCCDLEMIDNDFEYVCSICGKVIQKINCRENENFDVLNINVYQSRNYLNDMLNILSNRKKIKIDDNSIESVKNELKKNRINNPSYIDIRIILKKLNMQIFNSDIHYILIKITGKQDIILSKKNENKIRKYFLQAFEAYKIVKFDRTNFLNYNYVIIQILRLLNLYKFEKFFSILKSRKCILYHNEIWKLICNKLNWIYQPI
jgi:hypothetical protein